MASNKVTVSAIAEKAGVSPATVSRVLNNRTDLVKGDTVRRVLSVMQELGYSIPENKLSVPREQPVIIMNIPSVNNIFYSQVIQGAIASANAHGCHLIINQAPMDHGYIQSFFNLIKRVNAAGVILTGPVSTEILEQIGHMLPLIQCCEYNPDVNFPFVSINDYKAAQTTTEYLIAQGYHKIAFINGPANYKYSRDRELGFLAAIENANITIPSGWMPHLPEVSYDMAYSIACQLLSAEVKPNAFFTVSDTYAAAVIRAAKQYHYHIPKDIVVIGFDNTEISSICTPSITTVSQPRFQIGYTACEILLEKINNPHIESRSILLETELIVREST